MLTNILRHGAIAGAIVAVPMLLMSRFNLMVDGIAGMAIGYLIMLAAFSMVFLAIKRQRDVANGGAIAFLPAFAIGLGVTLIATVFYVMAWEVSMATTQGDFAAGYAQSYIAEQEAKGLAGAELARLKRDMADFVRNYANPVYRMGMTATEILPVGVLVSLIAAGLLRNSRFLPARAAAAA